jgi:hypothetical protein
MLIFVVLFALLISILASPVKTFIELDKLGVFTYRIKVWVMRVRQPGSSQGFILMNSVSTGNFI